MASLDSSLLQAAAEGDLSKVQQLVEKKGASVNVQGQMNRTPLHVAALYGKLEVVMYLREKGAKLDVKGSSGEVPLHLAVLNGHNTVVEYLLGEGADWKITNSSGKKPADIARKPQMKKLFEEAEKGIFNNEEEEVASNPKKKKPVINQKLVEELVAVGYSRGEVLDTIYTLSEKGEESEKMVAVVKELEKRKEDKKKTNKR